MRPAPVPARRSARHARQARAADRQAGREGDLPISSIFSAALAISPSRSAARSRGLPRPATSRASARPEVGHRPQRLAQAVAAQRLVMAPLHQRQPRLDRARGRSAAPTRSAPSSRRPGAVTQRSIVAKQATRDAPALRAANLQAVARRRVDRHCRLAGDPARRVKEGTQHLSASRRDRPAGRPPRPIRRARATRSRRASPPRTAPSARARRSGCRTRPCPRSSRTPGTVSAAIVSAGASRASSDLRSPGPHAIKLEPPGRNVGGGNAVFVADAAHRGEPVGGPRLEQGLLGQRAGRDQPDDRAVDQRLGTARLARLGRAFDLLGDGDAVPRADQPCEIGLRPNAPARRTSARARRYPRRVSSAQCRASPPRPWRRRRTIRRNRPSGRTARHHLPRP